MDGYRGGKVYFFKDLSLCESMFLSNLFSWSKIKNFKEPVYKTDEEMADEIHCGIRKIGRIKKKFKNLGLIIIGKQQNSQFLGATPYTLDCKKILDLENSVLSKELDKMSNGVRQNGNRRLPNCLTAVAKMANSYIEADTQQLSQQNKHPSLLNASPASESLVVADAPRVCSDLPKSGLKKKSPSAPSRFREWYQHYPKKVSLGSAEKAFIKIEKELPDIIQAIIDRTILYKKLIEEKGTEKKFIPHPATWLNGKRWEDEDLNEIANPSHMTEAEKRAEVDRIEAEYYAKKEQEKLNAASQKCD